MPRGRRRRRGAPSSAGGFDLLDELLAAGARHLAQAAANAASRTVDSVADALRPAPGLEQPYRCHLAFGPQQTCGEATGLVCFSCQRPFCHEHAEFYNDDGWAICPRCMKVMISSVQQLLRLKGRKRSARPRQAPARPRPPATKTPWEILGVQPTADHKAIKRAFHKLALEHHPDRNPADPVAAAERFQEAADAYNAMRDALDRRESSAGGAG